MAVATYPGTVSPLRGLDPFGEAERDVWQGRETQRDELAKMVTADGFRAGLLYGEPGVGKTSLVRAGLIPHLKDHGIVAVMCEDLASPASSLAQGLASFGMQPNANELPIAFITRCVSNAVMGQQFVFVIDDIDLGTHDDRVNGEIAEMFSKIVSRSSGRARFLFVCASDRLNALAPLEKRTGSLFPPSTRYELPRIPAQAATTIFDRILALSGVAADPALAEAVMQGIGRGRGLLAADLQVAAMAMRDLGITSLGALQKIGGASELEARWLQDVCRSTGNERSAMRLVAELAAAGPGAHSADAVAQRVNLDAQFANQAFGVLESRGLVIRGEPMGSTWMLRHEVLTQRVKEATAPARAAARRAYDLFGSKVAAKGRLSLKELRHLRAEGIQPSSPEEAAVLQRSKRYYMIIGGAIAAVPLVLLIMIYVSMRGRVYFDLEAQDGADHVLVRGGRAGLSPFGFLPGTGYGRVLADTGLTRSMVAPEQWKRIDSHDIGSDKSGWDDQLMSLMAPQLAGLITYAATGKETVLTEMRKAAKDTEDLTELLTALRPIARGTPTEVQIVEEALATKTPALIRTAMAVAGDAASRREGAYQDTLTKALVSEDADVRPLALSVVRDLGERGRALFKAALARNPDQAIRRELLADAAASGDDAPTIGNAMAALGAPEITDSQKARAKEEARAAVARDPQAAAAALAPYVKDGANNDVRQFAIELLRDIDPAPQVEGLVDSVKEALSSPGVKLRAVALPLLAKLDPESAKAMLGPMLEDRKLELAIRVGAALAWGELAATSKDEATAALDKLLKEESGDVRAAAATAAGKLGRQYQEKLHKMAKAENYNVRLGAAEGLAQSLSSGGSAGVALDGIMQLWREKGRPRKDAAKILANLARKKPLQQVVELLGTASRLTEDPSLHPIGVEGLCNAIAGGSPTARGVLKGATDDPDVAVRRMVMQCVLDGPDPAKNAQGIATKMIKDADNQIRADAARVLATAAANPPYAANLPDLVQSLLEDQDREVRVIGIRAVGSMGAQGPDKGSTILSRRFQRADEGEKLAITRAAKSIGMPASDIIAMAIADASPAVRVAAVDAALGAGVRAPETVNVALADPDPSVRKAALERIATQKDKLDATQLARALSLAVRDPNPELSQIALTTMARIQEMTAVEARLRRALSSRIERERAQAAAAAIGLVDRDPGKGLLLLEPLLDDPSHDVRAAMLPALAAAYAKTNTLEKVSDILTDSEDHAMRRLVAAGAFFTFARNEGGRTAAEAALKKIDGPPMARFTARIVAGLIAANADGIAFLQELVP